MVEHNVIGIETLLVFPGLSECIELSWCFVCYHYFAIYNNFKSVVSYKYGNFEYIYVMNSW